MKYILFILLIIVIINILQKLYTIESLSQIKSEEETFIYALRNTTFSIVRKQKFIKYNNRQITGQIGQIISIDVIDTRTNKKYIILRYPDFKNEIKRHSREYMKKYFTYLNNSFIDHKKNYIFDFIGYHGVIDDKVRLWIQLKKYYGRSVANKIMPKTYLIPNDYTLFWNEYIPNKKYMLKNSFGGARSALYVTTSKYEIENYFKKNKIMKYDAYQCGDATCHSKVKYNIIQEYIVPTFLINGRKIGLRLYLVIIPNKSYPRSYIFKNGVCYYSLKKYNPLNNLLDSNVVGSCFKNENYIKKHNLPDTYINFKKYMLRKDKAGKKKLIHFENTLIEYMKKIVKSNAENLTEFHRYENIQTFTIYAFDIEFDTSLTPVIYEGNIYFTRYNSKHNMGKLMLDMYNDIYYKLGYAKTERIGFLNVL